MVRYVYDFNFLSRVEVLHNTDVEPFSPPLPSPPLFLKEEDLCKFLVLKRMYVNHLFFVKKNNM